MIRYKFGDFSKGIDLYIQMYVHSYPGRSRHSKAVNMTVHICTNKPYSCKCGTFIICHI